jgi:hypothetical protein
MKSTEKTDEHARDQLTHAKGLEAVNGLASAMYDLPILARLEFARNLVESHGGTRDAVKMVPQLVVATEVLNDIIEVVKARPRIAKLAGPRPRLG